MANTENLRMLALDSLLEMQKNEIPCHIYIRNVLDAHSYLSLQERSFYKRLTEGTLEYRIQLDYVINQFAKTKTNKMKPMIREILRLGAYQILYMNAIPDSAAVNEAVKLAQKRGFASLKGFVNGVLRNVSRKKEELVFPDKSNPSEYIQIRYALPQYLADRWISGFGLEKTEIIAASFLEAAALSVRIRSEQPEETVKSLREAGIRVKKSPWLSYAYTLEKAAGLTETEAFLGGELVVQDVSSMLSVEAAAIKEGDLVLDLCAAPGGKSLLVADKLQGSGRVIARDLTENKALLIEENVMRCGLENVQIEVADATLPDESLFGRADVVIADLPCSGLGVIGRKADIKYYTSQEKINALAALQKDILKNAVLYLKPGGVLIFSTCTIAAEENEKNVAWIKENLPLKAEDLTDFMPAALQQEPTLKEGYLQLLPGIHPCDGFFISRFVRI